MEFNYIIKDNNKINMEESANIFIKKDVSIQEYKIHKFVFDLAKSFPINVPEPYEYNQITRELRMQCIPNMSISDEYGESSTDVPKEIFEQIRKIIKILYQNNIYYPDITGYNFIEHDGKIWIIDFGHACVLGNISDSFVNEFMEGKNGWNPDFL